jgi:signal transduction histidine kinase/ActR/RegA family two-component response regulator
MRPAAGAVLNVDQNEREEKETPRPPLSVKSLARAQHRAEQQLVQTRQELEQTTLELARSVALLRATLEATTDGVLVLSAERQLLHCNDNFLRMWRLDAGSLAAQAPEIFEQLCARTRQPGETRRIFQQVASEPAPAARVLELDDGRTLECVSRAHLMADADAGQVWTFRDITESRRVQDQLRDDARVLELLNSTGKILSSKLDLPSLLQTVTDAARELTGAQFAAFFYNQTDDSGNSYLLYTLSGAPREAFDKFGQPRATPLFAPTFQGGPPIRCDDVLADPRYAKMGSGMPHGHLPVRSYLAVSVISRSGEVIGGLFFGHSKTGVFGERAERIVTGMAAQTAVAVDNARLYQQAQRASAERQQLLESERSARSAAERSSALKDEFLAILSHELRTPLNAILGWSQMLRLGSTTAEGLEKGLSTIERNARLQTQLIEDLLDMSRILAGKVRLDVQSLQPTSCVEAAIDTVRPSAAAKGVQIVTALDATAGQVLGDPSRLQQVMWNLLSNAIKFTAKGGTVQVALQRAGAHIEITVVDTGAGIEPEFLPHVFDRFRQAEAATTRRHGGLGLGLSIVKHVIELHGGSVRAASPGPGQGATFVVQLPLSSEPRAAAEQRQQAGYPSSVPMDFRPLNLDGVKVLVVDDEEDARELIQRVLSECGATASTAGGAVEALTKIERERPDVLVSDIGMPELDGYELLRRVRRLEAQGGRRIPAIALTAFARPEDRARALRAGFLLHIAKPVEPSELVAGIASALGRIGVD